MPKLFSRAVTALEFGLIAEVLGIALIAIFRTFDLRLAGSI